jgi:hypothetical protein
MKVCKKCNIEKNYNNFPIRKDSKDGYRNECKECIRKNKKFVIIDEYININKKCLKCNEIKEINSFSKDKSSKDGYLTQCKYCRKEYYELNKNLYDRTEYMKKYKNDNKSRRNDKLKIRRKYDILFNLTNNMRSRINETFKSNGYTKNSKTIQIIDCSFEELKEYLESKFEPWMNWDNRGLYNSELNYGWDIDHIIPLSSGKTEEEIVKLNHYTNLQPLCSKINRDIKKDKLNFKSCL